MADHINKCGECGGRAVFKGYEKNLMRCTECGFTAPSPAAPAVPAVDALTRYDTSELLKYDGHGNHSRDGSFYMVDEVDALLAAPADPEQANLDSLAQAGLAAALENRARQPQAAPVAEWDRYATGVLPWSRRIGPNEELQVIADAMQAELNDLRPIVAAIQAAPEATSEQMGGAQVAKVEQPLIGKLLDEFSALPVLWGLNEPGALVRHSDVFKMLIAAGKSERAAEGEATERKPLTLPEVEPILNQVFGLEDCQGLFNKHRMFLLVQTIEQHHGITGGGK